MPEEPLQSSNEPTEPEIPTDDAWKDEYKQQWMQMRMGHEAMMLNNVQKELEMSHQIARGSAAGNFEELINGGEEDMGVSIGNRYEIHNHGAGTEQSAPPQATIGALPAANEPPPSPEPLTVEEEGLLRKLLPYIATAIGGGGAVGGALLAYELATKQPNIPEPTIDTNTHSVLEGTLGFPNQPKLGGDP